MAEALIEGREPGPESDQDLVGTMAVDSDYFQTMGTPLLRGRNFGSADRVDYTAVGESINLASRMEGLNKYLGTKILITAGTHEGLTGRLLTRFLGPFKLKGFEKSVPVYELVGSLDRAEAYRPLQEAFAQALNLFQQKDFTMAQLAFRQVLEIDPADGPAQFYLKSISEVGDRPLPADWKGETVFTEK